MGYLILKFTLSAALVVAISEASKRSPTAGALIASLPITSILAMCWLYRETGDTSRVAQLSSEILWLVIPSLLLFLLLPALLRRGLGFASALSISCAITCAVYFIFYKFK